MKYKLIVSDFDGTLYRRDKTIAPETIAAIGEFRRRGGVFTIATGRMFASIRQFAGEAGLPEDILISSYQGQLISEAGSGRIINANGFTPAQTKEILAAADKKGIYAHFYAVGADGKDRLYAKEMTAPLNAYAKYCRVEANIVGNLAAFLDAMPEDTLVLKVLMMTEPQNLAAAKEYLDHELGGKVQLVSAASNMVDAIIPDGGKHTAVKFLADFYGTTLAQTACVGDEDNDLKMIVTAGLGCAVANANEEVKAAADLVLPSCDEDAVGTLIREHILV